MQEPQLGTGHALLQAEPHLRGARGTLVLLSGDVPLLRPATLRRWSSGISARGAAATVLTARVDDPQGYGRIVRDDARRIAAIVEDKDATPDERAIDEINSGIYAFDAGAPVRRADERSAPTTRRGSTTFRISCGSIAHAGSSSRRVTLDDAREILGREQPKGAGGRDARF